MALKGEFLHKQLRNDFLLLLSYLTSLGLLGGNFM